MDHRYPQFLMQSNVDKSVDTLGNYSAPHTMGPDDTRRRSVSFRCPTTQTRVVAEIDDATQTMAPMALECLSCGKIHVVDPLSGDVKSTHDLPND